MPDFVFLTERDIERFESRIMRDPNSGCWLWTGCLNHGGYGRFWVDQQNAGAATHRVSYFIKHKTEIPSHLEIDHLCKVKSCCNPDHLELVTHAVNIARITSRTPRNSKKTHCPEGHPYSGENLYIHRSKAGKINRLCQICRLKKARERYRRSRDR
jgi:hypothetical protein